MAALTDLKLQHLLLILIYSVPTVKFDRWSLCLLQNVRETQRPKIPLSPCHYNWV